MLLKFFRFALACSVALSFAPATPTLAEVNPKRESAATYDLVRYVNPFVGMGRAPTPDLLGGNASANVFPGAALPFGMAQFSPDTNRAFQPGASGSYDYEDTAIRGFSLTHLSGPGCGVFGDAPFLPIVGKLDASPSTHADAYNQNFSHKNESAAPGFYEVTLDSGVKTQLTVTTRTGFAQFVYPSTKEATLLINLGRNGSGVTDASAQIIGDREIVGSITSGGFCGSRNKYTLYFVAQFDRPFNSFGSWLDDKVSPNAREAKGAKSGAFVSFERRRTVRF